MDSKSNIVLGIKIKKLREQANMSQEMLAKRMLVNRNAITQIEAGKRDIKSHELVIIARTFNISVDELLDIKKGPEITLESHSPNTADHPGIRISVPQKNIKKFKEVLLYILNILGSRPNIGETVIYKLLYFIDFDFYEKYEEQLIGATYQKNHYGPTPMEFKKIVENMMEEEEIRRVKDEYFNYPRTKYLPLREPDLSIFTANEIKLIDSVIGRLGHMNASEISKHSHGDVPWLTTEDQQIIEYESVFYRTSPYSVRSDKE
jgi:transcriptional regulator with XRE-family HTH domain